ncbi:DUF1905 domain-containing protein [Sphingosinicella sp. CPCC 101087]|uniref:DUF1905 domain-containing protein n=1 Tax=Sphingosinicella sp. CPCC 101087 TaxID=2497754 RepID=UPI00101BED88|nr:DUF1905 domain-containing protein [Sphingosinicella sp. CPCC 101087]
MNSRGEPLLCVEFDAEVIHWRGPAPYLFAPVPEHHVAEIRYAARSASYGWGVVPVEARIGTADFTTSLFPKGETYLLPVKAAVQKAAGVGLGDNIHVVMRITGR